MFERHELEAFLVLAEELHFGRTAERLHLSTSRISQTIAKLERRIGVPLFDRTSRRVELSPVGRRLYEDLRPAWDQISAAFDRAVEAGRGISGVLDVAFTGAAAGQLLVGVIELFRKRHSDCDVRLREAQIAEAIPWLRDGEVDIALADVPIAEPGIVSDRPLIREARMLAVPSGHPLAQRTSVSIEDLSRTTVLQLPDTLPEGVRIGHTPERTPSGRPIPRGPSGATFQELLTLVGAGHGVFPVGAHVRRYNARPDVVYIPFDDAPPLEWCLSWRTDSATARVRAFVQAAHDLLQT